MPSGQSRARFGPAFPGGTGGSVTTRVRATLRGCLLARQGAAGKPRPTPAELPESDRERRSWLADGSRYFEPSTRVGLGAARTVRQFGPALYNPPMPGSADCQLATLLVHCPDRRGIVAALAQLLFGHGANILDSDQHSDVPASQFFQRLRFDLSELLTDRGTLERAINEVAERFEMKVRLSYENDVKRVALFVSKYDHCLVDLLHRHRSGELNCHIPVIISNHAELEPIARHFEIPFRVFPLTKETKREQEARELELLEGERIDLVVLARYMQILTPEFIGRYPLKIINIHHSFLPAFIGGRPYHQAYERGVKLIGATAHYATANLDEGPIIEQDVIRCSHRDTVADLTRKGRDVEKLVLARAVRHHLDDRVIAYGNKTVVFD